MPSDSLFHIAKHETGGLRVALDPGKMTGICVYDHDTDEWEAFAHSAGEAMPWLHKTLDGGAVREVVSEDIVITQATAKKGQDVKWSLEQIGITRYLCYLYGVPFELQQPNEAKGFCKDETLKALDLWTVGSDHARDATRHMVLRRAKTEDDFRLRIVRAVSSE